MASLESHARAEDELDALFASEVATDREAAAIFDAVLDELSNNGPMLDELCIPQNYFKNTPSFEIKKYAEMQKRGFNIYILKVRTKNGNTPKYRALIGHDAQRDIYWFLAILDREIDYDPSDPSFSDSVKRYAECGIRTYK